MTLSLSPPDAQSAGFLSVIYAAWYLLVGVTRCMSPRYFCCFWRHWPQDTNYQFFIMVRNLSVWN